jgi:hypothetical protein
MSPISEVRMTDAYPGETARAGPDSSWVRGDCPECGAPVVSNAYWQGGRGYVILWECWEALGEAPTCAYRREL